jgi:hypothetical protein
MAPHLPGEEHKPPGDIEIRVYSHSALFYWWPVWAAGFIMGALSMFDGHRLAIVPDKTEPALLSEYSERKGPDAVLHVTEERSALIFPESYRNHAGTNDIEKRIPPAPFHRTAYNKNYGVMFAMVLLVVIAVTNVPLRGMWSLMIIVTLVMLSIIFALAGTWEWIFDRFAALAIFMNAGGYFFISIVLLIMWTLAVFIFDRQLYMTFTPGQFRVCQQIGGGEQAFPTEGMTLEKHRSDLFRHWILGLGSGDLTVKTVRGDHFDLHNVLFVGRKKSLIEDMMREKAVVRGH